MESTGRDAGKNTGKIDHSTFDNAMIRQALKDMAPEDLKRYQDIGGDLYKAINFAKNQVLNNIDPPTEEKIAYIKEGFKSGILPKDLEPAEIELLIETYGDRWFEHFGFTEEDIGEMAKDILVEVQQFRRCGRNEKCPCKSGKKFKVCHGKQGKKYNVKAKLPMEVADTVHDARRTAGALMSPGASE